MAFSCRKISNYCNHILALRVDFSCHCFWSCSLLTLTSNYPNNSWFPGLALDLCPGLSLRAFAVASSFPSLLHSWVPGPVVPGRTILDPITCETKMGVCVSGAGWEGDQMLSVECRVPFSQGLLVALVPTWTQAGTVFPASSAQPCCVLKPQQRNASGANMRLFPVKPV